MQLFSWLHKRITGQPYTRRTTARKHTLRFRPRLESLECRVTPSFSTLAPFGTPSGAHPMGSLIMDSSGNLYGTAPAGGASNLGTVFEMAHGSGTITTLGSFNSTSAYSPNGTLALDSSGNLYGTATGGGTYSHGIVFELAHGSGTITTLASFNGSDGAGTCTGLVLDSSGNLYGTTHAGGASGDGVVFELAAGSGTITALASFNGQNPDGGLVVDSSGNLYGTTFQGGAAGDGTVFELPRGSGTIATLASFNGADGTNPVTGLVMGSSGNLYGTADFGGALGYGTVFELAAGSGTITALASFNATNGADPSGAVNMDSSGNLYGTTWAGGASGVGTVFQLARGSNTITALASFSGNNGENPEGGVTIDGSGNLYGTTYYGGSCGDGTVVELAHGSGTITALFSFNDNGDAPGGLVMDGSANLYGATYSGGVFGDGTLFELAQGSGTITALAVFNGANGANPVGSLVMDSSGNLYGEASAGGASGDGTVFELAHGSGTITTLASFNGSNGQSPAGGLMMDISGNLYGTTSAGGAAGDGTVFELARGSSTITTLASFSGSNGQNPEGGVIEDSSGNLCGTTYSGGTYGVGTVFELAAGSSTITTLASFDGGFNGTDGRNPQAGLTLNSSNGNLFGTTVYGGDADSDGTVFELVHGSGTITTLAVFNGLDGANPDGALILNGGALLGTTVYGGQYFSGNTFGYGTVFALPSGGGAITTRLSFSGTDNIGPDTIATNGAYPQAGLIVDSGGNLYGTTTAGGAGGGTVFELSSSAAQTPSYQISSFPSSTTAGAAQRFTVTVRNPGGTIDTSYTGTIQFTSSDPRAVLPARYTFTAADAGVHVFTVTLETAGAQSITATDKANSSITGGTTTTVTPAAATHLVISGPSSVAAGVSFSITVTAYDAYGNVATGYTGTIHFTSSDSTASLPANYTFTTSDAGTHTFSGVVLKKKGNQSIMATDNYFSSITYDLGVHVF
jgi:uncharacterized repeat protein (TIGR03803 family)